MLGIAGFEWRGLADRIKFVLFSIGLAVAVASSFTSFYFLYSSVLGRQSLVYEPSPVLALVEMVFLVLAIGTCVAASEVYYRYLKLRESVHVNGVD